MNKSDPNASESVQYPVEIPRQPEIGYDTPQARSVFLAIPFCSIEILNFEAFVFGL